MKLFAWCGRHVLGLGVAKVVTGWSQRLQWMDAYGKDAGAFVP